LPGDRISLVPPSLKVIAGLITHKKRLDYVVAQLEDTVLLGNSYAMLKTIGWPTVKVATASIGNGLTVAYTETQYLGFKRGLLWVSELACHPMCAFLDRICQGNLDGKEWLEKIEKKHLETLDRLPSI
jgi:hypothetical protein